MKHKFAKRAQLLFNVLLSHILKNKFQERGRHKSSLQVFFECEGLWVRLVVSVKGEGRHGKRGFVEGRIFSRSIEKMNGRRIHLGK